MKHSSHKHANLNAATDITPTVTERYNVAQSQFNLAAFGPATIPAGRSPHQGHHHRDCCHAGDEQTDADGDEVGHEGAALARAFTLHGPTPGHARAAVEHLRGGQTADVTHPSRSH